MPKTKVFYGWWIVLASAIIGLYTGGAFFYGFTVFVDPMVEAFDWTYLAISLAASFRSVEMGVAAPIMGFLVDRIGPRKLVFFGGLVGGLGFILLSRTSSLAMFYGVFIVLSIGFSACASVVLTTAVANWFHRRVSLAMGLTTTGFGMGGLLLPVLVWLINHYQWQTTLVILGIGTWLTIPLFALVIRHKPEQYGYLPDGDTQLPDSQAAEIGSPETEFEAGQALRTRAFWLLSMVLAIQSMGMNGVILHVMPYLSDVKLAKGSAALVATFIPLLSIVGRLGLGWLGDVFAKKHVLALALGFQTVGLLVFCYAPTLWSLIVFLITFSTGYGGAIALRPAIQREYFGRDAFGSIQGMIMAIMTLGGIIGPVFTGWVRDTKADYHLAWLSFAIATAVAIPLVIAIKFPQKDG